MNPGNFPKSLGVPSGAERYYLSVMRVAARINPIASGWNEAPIELVEDLNHVANLFRFAPVRVRMGSDNARAVNTVQEVRSWDD